MAPTRDRLPAVDASERRRRWCGRGVGGRSRAQPVGGSGPAGRSGSLGAVASQGARAGAEQGQAPLHPSRAGGPLVAAGRPRGRRPRRAGAEDARHRGDGEGPRRASGLPPPADDRGHARRRRPRRRATSPCSATRRAFCLWAGGHREALQIAVGPGFLPGHLCSERAVGTNAVGTALELDHPVQIFSAEHFNRRLHGWTCSAAPIHDPESHRILGVLDLSGSFRTGHPHSLSLVSAVARVIEDKLAEELRRRDERLKALYLERVAPGTRERSALITSAGRVLAASPRGWLGQQGGRPRGRTGDAPERSRGDRRADRRE